jgi:hypothetical protein
VAPSTLLGTVCWGWAGSLLRVQLKAFSLQYPPYASYLSLLHSSVFLPLIAMPRTLRQSLRELSPIVATATIITTLVVCVIITKARNVYVGGLKWPYFSDMGRDKPAYYVFCIGLSLTAVTIASTWLFNAEFQRRVLGKSVFGKSISKSVQRLSTTATTLAVVAVVGLPILVRTVTVMETLGVLLT